MNKYFVIQKLNVSINHPKTTLRFKISYRHIQQQGQLLWVRVHSAYVRNVLFHRIAEEFIQPLNPTCFSKQGQLGQKLLWNLTSWNLSNSVDEGFMSSLAESLFLCLTLLMVKSFFKNFTGAFFTATSVHCLSFYYCATLTRVWHFFPLHPVSMSPVDNNKISLLPSPSNDSFTCFYYVSTIYLL